MLTSDKGRPPGGTALLGVPVGKERPLIRDRVDGGCLIAHHPLVIGADIPVSNIITPDDQDVGLFRRKR